MMNLKLIDGDINFDILGRAELIYDTDNKIQSIKMRLNTIQGELFYNDAYGIIKYRGKFDEKIIEEYFKEVIMQDEDISDVELISFEKSQVTTNSYNLVFNITLNTNEVITIDEIVISL